MSCGFIAMCVCVLLWLVIMKREDRSAGIALHIKQTLTQVYYNYLESYQKAVDVLLKHVVVTLIKKPWTATLFATIAYYYIPSSLSWLRDPLSLFIYIKKTLFLNVYISLTV